MQDCVKILWKSDESFLEKNGSYTFKSWRDALQLRELAALTEGLARVPTSIIATDILFLFSWSTTHTQSTYKHAGTRTHIHTNTRAHP